jgi:hypothetical protein
LSSFVQVLFSIGLLRSRISCLVVYSFNGVYYLYRPAKPNQETGQTK